MSSKRGLVLTLDLAPVFPSLAGQASRQTDTMTACVASEEVLHPFSFPLRFSRQHASGTLVEPNRDETSQPFASLPPPSLACLPARSTCPSPPLLLPLLPFATRSAAACLKVGRSVGRSGWSTRQPNPTQPSPGATPSRSFVRRQTTFVRHRRRRTFKLGSLPGPGRARTSVRRAAPSPPRLPRPPRPASGVHPISNSSGGLGGVG